MRRHQTHERNRSTLACFSVLTRSALALVFFIMCNSLEPFYYCALLMVLFLITNVVYHPLQILGAETNDAVTGLPIQQLPICEFVIDVMRTRAFWFSNPIANQKRRRYRDGDMNVCFSAADFMKYQPL